MRQMNKKFYKLQQVARQEDNRPSLAFRNFFNGPHLWANEALWKAYQEWHKTGQEEEFARFEDYILKNKELARQQIEEWENPLVNGKKGECYSCSFHVPPSVKIYRLVGLDELGLRQSIDPQEPGKCSITGVPSRSGEFKISFVYAWHGYRRGAMPPLRRELTININPDPRELWRDIPTSRNLEYFKEDMEAALTSCSGRSLLAASRRGRSHAHVGLPRDDDFALGCVNDWNILSVADGAGSAKFSRQGSAIACQTALAKCRQKLAEANELDTLFLSLDKNEDRSHWLAKAKTLAYSLLPDAIFEAFKAIREEAQARDRQIREYATTLLLVLSKKFPAGWIVLSFQVGDGAMAMFHDQDKVELLANPDEGEYGGQTRFVTMKEIYESNELMNRLRVDLVEELDAILLMSDGVSDAKFGTLANLRNADYWHNLWAELQPLLLSADPGQSLLDWLQFWSQGNHDDRTLAIMF